MTQQESWRREKVPPRGRAGAAGCPAGPLAQRWVCAQSLRNPGCKQAQTQEKIAWLSGKPSDRQTECTTQQAPHRRHAGGWREETPLECLDLDWVDSSAVSIVCPGWCTTPGSSSCELHAEGQRPPWCADRWNYMCDFSGRPCFVYIAFIKMVLGGGGYWPVLQMSTLRHIKNTATLGGRKAPVPFL